MFARRLGDSPAGATDTGGNWWDFIPSLVTAGAAVFTQQQLLDYNKQAIAQGLPLLSASQIAQMSESSQPGVNIGMSADVKSLLTYAFLGAGALALFYTLMRRAR